VPIALATGSATPAAAPSFSAPSGQKLKSQKGVKVRVTCPAACTVALGGSVKVGAKTLKLKALKGSLAAGAAQTFTVKVADAKVLKKAKGKAKATIKASATAGGQTTARSVAVSLNA
jgi:hypothetical protein